MVAFNALNAFRAFCALFALFSVHTASAASAHSTPNSNPNPNSQFDVNIQDIAHLKLREYTIEEPMSFFVPSHRVHHGSMPGSCLLNPSHMIIEPSFRPFEFFSSAQTLGSLGSLGSLACDWVKEKMALYGGDNDLVEMDFRQVNLIAYQTTPIGTPDGATVHPFPVAVIYLKYYVRASNQTIVFQQYNARNELVPQPLLLALGFAYDPMTPILHLKLSETDIENNFIALQRRHSFSAQVRHFHIVEQGACAFFDGRFITEQVRLCDWAHKIAQKFPSAGITVNIVSLSLVSNPMMVQFTVEMSNPVLETFNGTFVATVVARERLCRLFTESYLSNIEKHLSGSVLVKHADVVSPASQFAKAVAGILLHAD